MASGASRNTLAGQLVLVAQMGALGALVIAAGCGRPQTSVRGTVTLDGKPLSKAIVQFWPERGNASTAVAVTDAQGRFATPLKPVPFKVTLVAQIVDGKKANPENPSGPLIDNYKDVVPKLYVNADKTPLRIEPVADTCTVADFALESEKPPQPF
jgi:hypothetical protein